MHVMLRAFAITAGVLLTTNLPRTSEAEVLSYGCVDNSGNNPTDHTITIDTTRKIVRETMRAGLSTCAIYDEDGRVGPSTTPDKCTIPFVGDMAAKAIARHSVEFDGDSVTFGGVILSAPIRMTEEEKNQFGRLNLRTGLYQNYDGTRMQCNPLPRAVPISPQELPPTQTSPEGNGTGGGPTLASGDAAWNKLMSWCPHFPDSRDVQGCQNLVARDVAGNYVRAMNFGAVPREREGELQQRINYACSILGGPMRFMDGVQVCTR